MKLAIAFLPLTIAGCSAETTGPVRQAERAIRAELRDPESAKFSDMQQCGSSPIVTGKVNARNLYGGFAGDVTFYVEGTSVFADQLERDGPFTDGFFAVHKGDGSLLIERCTAALEGKPLPTVSSDATSAPEMNAPDMNATDVTSAPDLPADAYPKNDAGE